MKTSCIFIVSAFLCMISCQKQEPIKPNIIYINVDDMGWMDSEVYGSKYYETPNINRLAKMGIRFTNGYAAAANCAPSRACLLSGQWTPRHGIYTVNNSDRGHKKTRKLIPIKNTTVLHDSVFTLAEFLKTQGYVTGNFGKWHLGDDPKTQGFDVNVGGYHTGNPGKDGYFSPYNIKYIDDNKPGENLTDRLTEEAIQFIKKNKSTPFFAYLPYYAVHTPLGTFPEIEEKYKSKPSDSLQNNAIYAGMIETVDKNLGLLLDTIEELNLDNTIVVFTSDNGGIRDISSQEPLRSGKGAYYEGGIRVPYIISWKEKIQSNLVSNTPISNLDFFPTFVEILETQLPEKILDGQSILPVLKGQSLNQRNLYFHFPIYLQSYAGEQDDARDPLFRTRPGSVIIVGEWKLHHYFENNEIELFNLKTDLGERNNLVDTYPEKALDLLAKLEEWREATEAPVPTELNPDFDKEFYDQKNKK